VDVTVTVTAADGSKHQIIVSSVAISGSSPTPPAGVTLRDVDGGLGYYGKFANSLPADPTFFPIAVWYESVLSSSDTTLDKGAGLNTYVQLVDASQTAGLIRQAGMHAFPSDQQAGEGAETVGYITSDEVDMSGTGWWGAPTAAQFTTLQQDCAALPADGRARITNFGKGIVFCTAAKEADATRMLTQYQDIVSADCYWFTDNDVYYYTQGGWFFGYTGSTTAGNLTTAQTRRASNYGAVVRKLRRLLSNTKPVWGFTELGAPFTYNTDATAIQPAQIVGATWSQIIAGARGIIYFNHSFGGTHQTQHLLRTLPYYQPIRDTVTALNARITRLAPVLNSQDAVGLATSTGSVDILAKWNAGAPYVFAHERENQSETVTFTLAGGVGTSVTVVDENRTIPVVKGQFSDSFADGNTVHIYQINT
jgi:hypothetical protein